MRLPQQLEYMAARRPSKNAVFMLEDNHIHAIGIQEGGGALIRRDVLLRNLEAHTLRIGIILFAIIDGYGEDVGIREALGQRFAYIGGKCGDATVSREMRTNDRDLAKWRGL
jgi:hypothetical protein